MMGTNAQHRLIASLVREHPDRMDDAFKGAGITVRWESPIDPALTVREASAVLDYYFQWSQYGLI